MKLLLKSLEKMWFKIIAPSEKISDSLEREKARLLLKLLGGVLPVGLVAAIIIPVTEGIQILDKSHDAQFVVYSLLPWTITFLIAKSKHYKVAVWLSILTALVIILYAAVPDQDSEDFIYLAYVMFFSSLFFSFAEISLVYLLCIGCIIPSIFFLPDPYRYESTLYPVVIVTIGGLLSLLGSQNLKRLSAMYFENQLKREAQLRTVLENTYDGTAEVRDGIIIRAQENFARLFGYTHDEIVGKSITQIISDHQLPNLQKRMLETTSPAQATNPLHLEIVLSPVEASNGHNQIVAVRNISERKAAEKELKQLALQDSVTGLYNRSYLLNHITDRRLTPKTHVTTSLLFLDLDNFKRINDTYGHEAGDKILHEVGKRLKQVVREKDVVARYGGDEFVLVYECAKDETNTIANRILVAFHTPFFLDEIPIHLTTSIGVVRNILAYGDVDEVLRAADKAMYHAKAKGKNQFAFANSEVL
ncbi:MAG: hypothetical protein Kow002_18650 [Anaerolineales bacterium]